MATATAPSSLVALGRRALAAGRAAGLDAAAITSAEPFTEVRRDLERRREEGLHGGMAFTYRNPARSTDPAATLPSARALVAGALGYGGPPPPRPTGPGPWGRVARYAWGDHYARLAAALDAAADVLRAEGWRAVVVVDQNHLVDRAVAHRAGLGWYGKSSLLLLPGAGSWSVLGSVLTDAPLRPTAEAPVPDGCGTCARCTVECPTGALDRPGVVDARRCLAWIVQAPGPIPREHREAMGDRVYGCDECQDACPPNRVVLRRRSRAPEPDDAAPADGPWVDLLATLEADDAALLDRHGRWYIAGRDPRWIRRNALVAVGNVGDPADPRVEAALRRALTGEDDLLAAHAAWAARRLGRDDLLAAARAPHGSELAAELAAPRPTPRARPAR